MFSLQPMERFDLSENSMCFTKTTRSYWECLYLFSNTVDKIQAKIELDDLILMCLWLHLT